MGFPRQEYWSGLPCLLPGDLSNPGIEPRSPPLESDSLSTEPPGRPWYDASCKESVCQCRRHKRCRFDPWVGKIPWRRKWQPTPVGSCLKNSKDRGAWWTTVHGVARVGHNWAHTLIGYLIPCAALNALYLFHLLVLKANPYRRNYCHHSYDVLEAQRGCKLPQCTTVISNKAIFTYGSVVQRIFFISSLHCPLPFPKVSRLPCRKSCIRDLSLRIRHWER